MNNKKSRVQAEKPVPYTKKKVSDYMLIVKYNRIDFFGSRIYTEDKRRDYKKADLKKAISFFNRNNGITIQVDNMILFWDCMSEFENKIVTVRVYDGMNFSEEKTSFNKIKKELYITVTD